MNPYGHDQGQNAWPVIRPGQTWLPDIRSYLIYTREGGTVLPTNGDIPFHVDNAQIEQYKLRLASIADSGRQADETLNQLSATAPVGHPARLALPAPTSGTASPGSGPMAGNSLHIGGYATTTPQSVPSPQWAQSNTLGRVNEPNAAWANNRVQTPNNAPQPPAGQSSTQYSNPYPAQARMQGTSVASYQMLASAGSRGMSAQQIRVQQPHPTMAAPASNNVNRAQSHGQPRTQPTVGPGASRGTHPETFASSAQGTHTQTGQHASSSTSNHISGQTPAQTPTLNPLPSHQGTSGAAQQDFGMVMSKDRKPTRNELILDLAYLSRLYGAERAKQVIVHKLRHAGHHDMVQPQSAASGSQPAQSTPRQTQPAPSTKAPTVATTLNVSAASTASNTIPAAHVSKSATPTIPTSFAPMPSKTFQHLSSVPDMSPFVTQRTDLPSAQPVSVIPPSNPAKPATIAPTTATATPGTPATAIPSTTAKSATSTPVTATPAQVRPVPQAASVLPPSVTSQSVQQGINRAQAGPPQSSTQQSLQNADIRGPTVATSQAAQQPTMPIVAPPVQTSILRDPSHSVLMQPPNTKTLARDILRSLSLGKASSYTPGRSSTVVLNQTTYSTPSQSGPSSAPGPSVPTSTIAPPSAAFTSAHSQPAPSSSISGPVPQDATVVSPVVAILRHDPTTASIRQASTSHGADRTEAPAKELETAAQPDIDMHGGMLTGPPSSSSLASQAHRQSLHPPPGAIFMDLVTPDPSPPLGTLPLDDTPAHPTVPSSTSQTETAFMSETQRELHDLPSYQGPEAAFGYLSPRSSPPLAARITEVEEDEPDLDVASASGIVEAAEDQSIADVDVEMDAAPSLAPPLPSSNAPSATPSVPTIPSKRNRAYIELPPLPTRLRAAHRRMVKKARLEETEEQVRAAAARAHWEELEGINALATEVLGEFPCQWENCGALLNSLRTLFKHFGRHLELEAVNDEVNCRWLHCGENVYLPHKMQHLSTHAPRNLLCPFADCGLEMDSDALLAHVKSEHNDTHRLLQNCMSFAPFLGPPPEPLVNGVYFPRIAQPAVMSQEHHQELGPWVLRQIHSASRYAPSRKKRSRVSEPEEEEDVWEFMDAVETHEGHDSSQISLDLDDLHDSLYVTRKLEEGEQVRVYAEDEYDTESDGEGDVKGEGAVEGEGGIRNGRAETQDTNAYVIVDGAENTAVEGTMLSKRGRAKRTGNEEDPLDLISSHSGAGDSEDGDIEMVDTLL